MYSFFFGDFTWLQLAVLAVSAVLIGINKTGVPGLGTVPVILLVLAFPARLSQGLQLVMLALTDLVAVYCYRDHVNWRLLRRLLPWAVVGIGAGSLTLRFLITDDDVLRLVIGVIVLGMSLLNLWRRRYAELVERLARTRWFGRSFALLGGFTTQVANAAGPVMATYLLTLKLPKFEYMRVAAWFFMLVNWIKFPVFISEGRIDWAVVRADSAMIPFILIGAALGVMLVKRLPQQAFERVVELLVVLSALYLCGNSLFRLVG